jgi:monoterpene epsilon-lactone hydrolase
LVGDSGGDPADPLLSPLYADLAGLPPLYIQASRDEGIVDDGRRFAARAREAGRSPEADEAIRRLAEWARPKLDL